MMDSAGQRYAEELDAEPELTIAELARRHQVSRQTVSAAITRYDPYRIAGRLKPKAVQGPIQEWRAKMGFSQVTAAAALGIGCRTLQRYETAKDIPRPIWLAMAYLLDPMRHKTEP